MHIAHACAHTRTQHACTLTHALAAILKFGDMTAPALKRANSRACDAGPVPVLADSTIARAFEQYIASKPENGPFQFGPYCRMKRAQAVEVSGLVANKLLLEQLFGVQPSGRFKPSQLERVINKIIDGTEINGSQFPNVHYSRWAAKQIIIMAAHTRRLITSELAYKQACRKADPIERALLDHLLKVGRAGENPVSRKRTKVLGREMSIDEDGWPVPPDQEEESESEEGEESEEEQGAEDEEEESEEEQDAEDEEQEDDQEPENEEEQEGQEEEEQEEEDEEQQGKTNQRTRKSRKGPEFEEWVTEELPGNVDDLLDMLTCEPSSSSKACPKTKNKACPKTKNEVRLPRFTTPDSKEGRAYIDALIRKGGLGMPKHAPVPPQRGAQKALALQKKPASQMKHQSTARLSSPVLGELKLTTASAKSYIQCRGKGEAKWSHIVTVYDKQSQDHTLYCRHIMRQLSREPLDKQDAVALRDSLLAGTVDLEQQVADSDAESLGPSFWA